jgi:hypothetical protein
MYIGRLDRFAQNEIENGRTDQGLKADETAECAGRPAESPGLAFGDRGTDPL